VLDNDHARLFRFRSDPNRVLHGCAFRRGELIEIDSPGDGVASFRRPALALAGPLVGYAIEIDDAEGRLGFTNVAITDLSSSRAQAENVAEARAGPQRFARVGSLVVRRSGGLAWISCPRTRYGAGSPRPSCVKPGNTDSVYKLDSETTKPRLLARGRRIAPRSLRLSGRYVYWTQAGQRRRAGLR